MNSVNGFDIVVRCDEGHNDFYGTLLPYYCAYSTVTKDGNVLVKYLFVKHGSDEVDALEQLHSQVVSTLVQYVGFLSHDIASPVSVADRVHLAILSAIVNGIEESINNAQD